MTDLSDVYTWMKDEGKKNLVTMMDSWKYAALLTDEELALMLEELVEDVDITTKEYALIMEAVERLTECQP